MADEESSVETDQEIDSVLGELKSALETEKPIEEPMRGSSRKRPRSGRSGKTALDLIFSLRCSMRETAGLEIPEEEMASLSVKPVASRIDLPLPEEERIIMSAPIVLKRKTYLPKRKAGLPKRRKRRERRQKTVRAIAKPLKQNDTIKKIVKLAKPKPSAMQKPARKKITKKPALRKTGRMKAKRISGKERLARLLMRAGRR